MVELRNVERELTRFRLRLIAAGGFELFGFALLVARLIFLQVVSHEDLATQAENNRISVVPIVPNRGLIIDRNGIVLADNYSAYTLEITRSQLADPIDQVIDQLGELVEIQPRDRRRFHRLVDDSRSFESVPIRTKLTDEEVARFTAQRFRFPGVEVKARLFRNYPYGEIASHVLGYIGRINQNEKNAMEDWPDEDQANYRGTEVIGKLGIEQKYERELHGTTGVEEVETSAGGRPVRAGGDRPAQRRGAGLRQQAGLRPEPVRRWHRPGKLEGTQRVDRQAAAEPRAARHLSARLDLQALHGDRCAHHRQAQRQPDHL